MTINKTVPSLLNRYIATSQIKKSKVSFRTHSFINKDASSEFGRPHYIDDALGYLVKARIKVTHKSTDTKRFRKKYLVGNNTTKIVGTV